MTDAQFRIVHAKKCERVRRSEKTAVLSLDSAARGGLQQPMLQLHKKIPGMQRDPPSSVTGPKHHRGGRTTDTFTSEPRAKWIQMRRANDYPLLGNIKTAEVFLELRNEKLYCVCVGVCLSLLPEIRKEGHRRNLDRVSDTRGERRVLTELF